MERRLVIKDPIIEDRFVNVNGVRLHYLDWEGDGEPVLFLPGSGEPASVFKWFAQRFFPEFRPIALTHRGIGKSEIPDGNYAVDQLVQDIHAFLDAIQINRVSVVGHSLGGAEATFFAAKYPGKVRRVINIDGCFITSEFNELYKQDPCKPPDQPIIPREALTSVDAYLNYIRRTFPYVDRIWSPAAREAWIVDLSINANGRIEEIDRSRAMTETVQSVREKALDYSQVTVPMLIILAIQEQHPNVPPSASPALKREADEFQAKFVELKRRFVQRINQEKSDATIVEMIGAAHHCYISHEEVTYTLILDFLRG